MPGAGNITINAANINLTNHNSILTLLTVGNINNTTGVDGQGINLAHDIGSSNIITGDIGNIGSLAAVNVLLGSATLILQY